MIDVVKNVYRGFGEDKVMRLASSIAFAAIFSIAPLVIVIVAVAGWFLGLSNGGHGNQVAENAILDQVARAAGPQTADTVRQLVSVAFGKPRENLLAQIVGWTAFVFGAIGLFGTLQDSLNSIWLVEASKGGWRQMLRARLASFAMILVIVVLLLATFAANATTTYAAAHFTAPWGAGISPVAVAFANQAVTVVAATMGFAAIYKVLPDVSIGWRDVWLGAFVTAVLFVAGEVAIAFYLAKAGVASAYGAAGSLLATLLWIYYSAIVLLIGAEFTKAIAGRVATQAPSTLRHLAERPAGIDPREDI
ncbi:MAG TPA: YihY/virulence factor BrkB family protein [Candidatus Tumulicola sp.]|jgi:membrane protein